MTGVHTPLGIVNIPKPLLQQQLCVLYLPHTAVSGAAVQSLSYKVTRKVLKGVTVSSDLLCISFTHLCEY